MKCSGKGAFAPPLVTRTGKIQITCNHNAHLPPLVSSKHGFIERPRASIEPGRFKQTETAADKFVTSPKPHNGRRSIPVATRNGGKRKGMIRLRGCKSNPPDRKEQRLDCTNTIYVHLDV